jgi:hypothetical protein
MYDSSKGALQYRGIVSVVCMYRVMFLCVVFVLACLLLRSAAATYSIYVC